VWRPKCGLGVPGGGGHRVCRGGQETARARRREQVRPMGMGLSIHASPCCGDIFCSAIMVAIEVGEECNCAYVVLHTTGPCEGCVVG
jgi:hypothetical protein